ncbi:MAG: VWA domain-containing protein [Armatimonadetes bacterium]|nr:VWA domain-containing protein [Armatimonadota bacterium]
MRFTQPLYLILLPILYLGLWWTGKQLLGMSAARKRYVLLQRGVLMTLVVLALAGVQAVRVHKRVCTVFVLDTSHSVSEKTRKQGEAFIGEALKHLRSEDQAGVIVFGRNPVVEVSPAHLKTMPPLYAAPDKSATDIAGALRLAMALFPDGYARRIVLLSDGNETDGDSVSAASVARTEDVSIDETPLGTVALRNEVLVTDVLMPSETRIGQPFSVRVVAESTNNAAGILRIDQDGLPMKEVPASLTPGKNALVTTLRADSAGVHRFRATLETSPDTNLRNNIGMGLVTVRGKPKVLLAEETPDPTAALEKALRKNDVEVVKVAAGGLPTRPDELQQYDSIVFSDFSSFSMSPQQMDVTRSAIRDTGIGFLMVGGEKSFLPGGYYGTPLAEALPVDLEVRQRKTFPAATVVIIVDTSGSMAMVEAGGIQKVQLAAKAAMETLKMLRPMDRFGVIVSGTGAGYMETDWESPIRPARNRDRTIADLSKMFAGGGGIYCRPSLELAAKAIVGEGTRVRHIIMLADGSDCDEQDGCPEIVAKLHASRVTLTTVAFGDGPHVPFLKQLAHLGTGNFYLARTGRDLPKLFTADVSIMTRSAIEEGAFLPKIAGEDEMLRGVDWQHTPPLLAYDLTSDRPLARTILRTHKDDPLLAGWQYGLGTSIAFTSDAKPRWARQWIPWGGFSTFWTNVVRSSFRRTGKTRYAITTQVDRGEAKVEMQAFTPAGEPINLLQPEVKISTPTGEGSSLTLQQEGLGRYRGRFPVSETGVYLLTVNERDDSGKPRVFTTGFAVPYPPEYRFTRANTALLQRLADTTGGKANPKPEEVFRLPPKPGSSVTDLWQLCVLLALILLLPDIATRRLALGLPEALEALARKSSEGWRRLQARRPAVAVETGARLLSVKQRVRQQSSPTSPVQPQSSPDSQPSQEKPQPPTTAAPTVGSSSKTTARLLDVKKRKKG